MAATKLSLLASALLWALLWIDAAAGGKNVDVRSLAPISRFDSTWIEYTTLRQTKIGRNKFVVSGEVTVHRNMGNEQYVDIKVFRKDPKTKAYKTPIYRDKKRICQYVANDKIAYPKLLQYSNLPEPGTCPVAKGTYFIKDFTMDADTLPPILINGEYMVMIIILDGNKEVSGLEVEAELS